MKSKKLFYTVAILSGIVIGTLVGNLTSDIDFLYWLSYGINFGLASPLQLNLGVLSLTFGFSVNLTISCIIFIVLSVIVGRKIMRIR